ncbi:hypothetical protein B5M42_002095 [Paenibacillus athensensis]|uniref:Thioredoxin domain-containing protein n=1 Tax=Paenibacillus athensensis TaxID=1967502 RepID=A0A4Y8QBN7_9BACL|nr:hypothetical protein [Paenibacillus athensensis]MCD1257629.1 hypothetical protein [Paenibacillus athensensis]
MSLVFFVSYLILWLWTIMLTVACVFLLKKKPAMIASNELNNSDAGLPKGMPFPNDGRLTLKGEQPNFSNALVIFSLFDCGTCEMLYPHLHRFQEKHPEIPINVMLFEEQEGQARQNAEKYQLKLNVIACNVSDIALFQTNMFPFGYALNEAGVVVYKGNINDEANLDMLATPITGHKSEKGKKRGLSKAG